MIILKDNKNIIMRDNNNYIVLGETIPQLFENIEIVLGESNINLEHLYVKEAGCFFWVVEDNRKLKYVLTKNLYQNCSGYYRVIITDGIYGSNIYFFRQ